MRPDMPPIEKHTGDDELPTLHVLETHSTATEKTVCLRLNSGQVVAGCALESPQKA